MSDSTDRIAISGGTRMINDDARMAELVEELAQPAKQAKLVQFLEQPVTTADEAQMLSALISFACDHADRLEPATMDAIKAAVIRLLGEEITEVNGQLVFDLIALTGTHAELFGPETTTVAETAAARLFGVEPIPEGEQRQLLLRITGDLALVTDFGDFAAARLSSQPGITDVHHYRADASGELQEITH